MVDHRLHALAVANVGEHFDGMPVTGQRRFQAMGTGQLQALLAAIAFGQGALQLIGRRRDVQAATLTIEQQCGT
ncbi:hypothetical protein D3C79_816310 [compost metagenome]